MLKKSKELTVKKPNQTIMITNGKITATQRKAYNVLLHKALQRLRINNNQITFLIPIVEIKEKAGIQATDNWHLKENLKQLMDIKINCVHENGNWAVFCLLSDIEKEGDLLKFVLSEKIRQALISNDYYTTLDLMIIRTLQGKYAIIFYELAMRYSKVEIPQLTIEDFKKLTGTENYRDFRDLRIKVITPAIAEINEKSDIKMSYEIFKQGRKVIEIKFHITKKEFLEAPTPKAQTQEVEAISCLATKSSLDHVDYEATNQELLKRLLAFKVSKPKAVKLLKQYPAEQIKQNLAYVESQFKLGKIKDTPAYVVKAIEENYFETSNIKEEQKKQEAALLAQKKYEERIFLEEIENRYQRYIYKPVKDYMKTLSDTQLKEIELEFVNKILKNANSSYMDWYQMYGLKDQKIEDLFKKFIAEKYLPKLSDFNSFKKI
jgi:plasmid replication initiation protein